MGICLLLLVGACAFGTIAWMKDSARLVNTFTYGTVDISLEETDIDEDGDVTNNNYQLSPGLEYRKDPTLTVLKNSEEAYVRIVMVVHSWEKVADVFDINAPQDFFKLLGRYDASVWKFKTAVRDEEADTMSFEFRYKETVSGFNDEKEGEDKELEPLFETFKVPREVTIFDLIKLSDSDFKIVIEGHAIQAVGFNDGEDNSGNHVSAEDVAWETFSKDYE